jgi:predicted HAD superfamily Cof-like phosphohydrolase
MALDVRRFQIKYGFPVDVALKGYGDIDGAITCAQACGTLEMLANHLYNHPDCERDVRVQRLALITEELSELAAAFAAESEHEVLDALTDLEYLTTGTNVVFGMEVLSAAAWHRVHASNMSKDMDPTTLKPVKGDDFKEPNLKELFQ